jgi:hypothetical protein
MIWASPETQAPIMKLNLGVKGWHAIYVGVFSGTEAPSRVWLKLEGDSAALERQNNANECYGNVLETIFKVANLNGESLEIAQQSSGFLTGCGVAYVKLIPLTQSEIERIIKDQNSKPQRGMTATNDCFGLFFHRRPTTAEEILREVEIFRDTDFDTLILQALSGGDKVSYPSRYGHMPGQTMDDFLQPGHRHVAESLRELARKKINPIKVMIDGAHEIGMKVHVGARPAGWTIFEPFPDFWETPFYKQHREWRCVDRDGTPVTRMSWAVPEVRTQLINALGEAVGFGADGAHIVFNRGFPVVLYEPAFVQLFQNEYGEDPRKLDEEKDPRIRKSWSEVVTTFMRELRVRMDQEQVRRGDGKRLTVSAMVLGTELNNYQYGLDIRRLVKEGLLDEISIYPWDFGGKKVPKFGPGAYDLNFFNEVCKPKGVPFRPSLPVHWPQLKDQVQEAISFFDTGADGVCLWDAPVGDAETWRSIYSRLGHVDEMRQRLQSVGPLAPKPVYQCFHILGEQVRDSRFPPWWGG